MKNSLDIQYILVLLPSSNNVQNQLNQAQLTENQQKMRSFTNSVSLREQLSNRLTTPKNSFGAKDLRSTVKSECKLSKTRPLFAEFQSEIAQINNYLSSTENISPCIKEVFVHWKDRNNRSKIFKESFEVSFFYILIQEMQRSCIALQFVSLHIVERLEHVHQV